jgi:hypothetical protein
MHKLLAILVLTTSTAAAAEQRPGRCVTITEAGKSAVVCNVPPSERCVVTTSIREDGAIITHSVCTTVGR